MNVIRFILILITVLPGGVIGAGSPVSVHSGKVKVWDNKNKSERRLVTRDATLVIDSAGRRLIIREADKSLELNFDRVLRVIADTTCHMRGGRLGRGFGAGFGGVAGALAKDSIEKKIVNDYWLYLEYIDTEGHPDRRLLEIEKESAAATDGVIAAQLGDKFVQAGYPEKQEQFDRNKLQEFKLKHDLTMDPKSHPLPEAKPGQALMVMVSPALEGFARGNPSAASFLFRGNSPMSGHFKVYANGKVIGINRLGTYCFAYLDPGEYDLVSLVSQNKKAQGFRMKLEGGQIYYFLQLPFAAGQEVQLTRHPPELVMFLLGGSEYCQWKVKRK